MTKKRVSELDLWKAYYEMDKMTLSELYNLRRYVILSGKHNFLKLVEYVIKKKEDERVKDMVT